jgi:predicted nucleic acid-binding protein
MRTIAFDASTLISFSLSGLAHLIPRIKERFDGMFIITPEVHSEIIGRPLQIKRYMMEALQLNALVESGCITVIDEERIEQKTAEMLAIANSIYRAKGSAISILHAGEASAIAAASVLGSAAIAMDERTARMVIEVPEALRKIMESRMHTRILMDSGSLRIFRKCAGAIPVVRSAELGLAAAELGILDSIRPAHDSGKMAAEAMLWSLKFSGCAIAESEIAAEIRMFRRRAG